MISDICFFVATEAEALPLLKLIGRHNKKHQILGNKIDYNHNVSVVVTRPGLNNSYSAAQSINFNQFNMVLNVGLAGAIDSTLSLGSVVGINTVSLLKGTSLDVVESTLVDRHASCVSSPKFLESYEKILVKCGVVDMELYAIRSVIPKVSSIKIVSDEHHQGSTYFVTNFRNIIDTYYTHMIEEIIERLK